MKGPDQHEGNIHNPEKGEEMTEVQIDIRHVVQGDAVVRVAVVRDGDNIYVNPDLDAPSG